MAKLKFKGRELKKLGYSNAQVIGLAMQIAQKNYRHSSKQEVLDLLSDLLENPENYLEDPVLKPLAERMVEWPEKPLMKEVELEQEGVPYKTYGAENINSNAIQQMDMAMKLPVTKAGALMPDAHHGYGLPIGGVLATENAIIPYGVGMDIGCRMCLTVYNLPANFIKRNHHQLKVMLKEHTKFGMKEVFEDPFSDHPIFEEKIFQEIKLLKGLKGKAYSQMGTSGGGNHFVEFGIVQLENDNDFELPKGEYLGILSHSGSRGMGAKIAQHYTQIAMDKCPLPKAVRNLAWLSLDSEEGQEYWLAMNLAGDYASACHHDIHRRLSKALGEKPAILVENHHNFAWKEKLADGTEVIVHRKGATPAGEGVLGIIPGSMTAPGYIVRGKGVASAIQSASHGAGRQMSRTRAKSSLTNSYVQKFLREKGVHLIGGGLDEAPMAYKDIEQVMAFQKDLVDILGTFTPKIVRMNKD